MSKLKENLFYWGGIFSFFLFVFFSAGFNVVENFFYGVFIYIFAAYLARPFVFKEPMTAPYAGDKLILKKDGFLRAVLFFLYCGLALFGLLLAI